MQLDTGPLINESLETSGVFILCATDIALAQSAAHRVYLKLESLLNS